MTIASRWWEEWPRSAILLLTLLLWSVLGLLTPYLLILVGIVIAIRLAVRGHVSLFYASLGAKLFLIAFLILAACFAATARSPADIVFALNFTALVLYGPLVVELGRAPPADSARRVALLALGGTSLALLMATFRLFVLGEVRADSQMFGAILLGNTAILLGFLSLIGLLADGPRRWVFLLGPPLGILVNALTGSRGPLIALVPLIVFAAVFMGRRLQLRWPYIVAATVAGLLLAAAITLGTQSRSATIVETLGATQSIEQLVEKPAPPTADGVPDATAKRVILWRAAFGAFGEAPLLGHGWARLMSAVAPYVPPEHQEALKLPSLHNDLADFAVAAGVVGIGVYLLLLATPLVASLLSARDSLYPVRLYGVAVLVISYVCAGLTDLMFGFEFHTALYICVSAILLGYCRDPAGSGSGSTPAA